MRTTLMLLAVVAATAAVQARGPETPDRLGYGRGGPGNELTQEEYQTPYARQVDEQSGDRATQDNRALRREAAAQPSSARLHPQPTTRPSR